MDAVCINLDVTFTFRRICAACLQVMDKFVNEVRQVVWAISLPTSVENYELRLVVIGGVDGIVDHTVLGECRSKCKVRWLPFRVASLLTNPRDELKRYVIGINSDQIELYDLPSKPRKLGDRRSVEVTHTVEAEAMPAATMRQIVVEAIEGYLPTFPS